MAKSPSRRQKSASRLFAVQALFQMEALGADMAETMREFETHRFGAKLDDDQYEEDRTYGEKRPIQPGKTRVLQRRPNGQDDPADRERHQHADHHNGKHDRQSK